jgi:two-component system, chemotaxis family, chemotaxis protein CheY
MNGKKLLVVEDSTDFQNLLKQLFEGEGYAVEKALNGEEALIHLRGEKTLPNLILLDLMMPIMDGYEFRRQQELDIRLANIPVVVMTAHRDAQINKEKISVKECLRKPLDIYQLLATVKKHCA